MRALTGGSIFLGLTLVLLSWDASRRFTHLQLRPHLPSFENRANEPGSSAPEVRAPVAPDAAVPKSGAGSGSGTPDSAPVEPAQSKARTSLTVQASIPTAKRFAENPALPVRQFPPGSKGHVDAIVTAIDSEESRNTPAPVARLYFAFFDRNADYEGLNYYIDEHHGGMSLEAIATEFAGSEEFSIRYGALDNAAYFDRVYRNIFDAPPDAMLRAQWIAQLEAGMSRGQLMIAFSESGAFQAATANEVFVTLAYAQALRRAPDPADFSRWVRFLDAGNPREAVIAGLLAPRR